MSKPIRFIIAAAFTFIFTLTGFAKVSKVEIINRTIILGGKTFGIYGAYEKLTGKIYFELDPANAANKNIVNLLLAPRNERGMVEAWTDLVVLQPIDQKLSRGVALVEVSNRGGKFSPRYFNRGNQQMNPEDPDDFGDGLLMKQGLTVIWIGWQFDVPEGDERLRLQVPVASNLDGSEISGLVRSDWIFDVASKNMKLGHRQMIGYPVADELDPRNVLTVRDSRDGQRSVVPRTDWKFGRIEENVLEGKAKVIPDKAFIHMDKGFEPGKIYEFVYVANNPPVVGLGLAAIRDIVAFAKYEEESPFPVRSGIAAGVSQTGRFLRQFLYQNFNVDENGRQCYDGMMVITAGAGRGSFNHQFAQPSRDAHRYSAFFYPTDVFPFTGKTQVNANTNQSDGILSHVPNKYRPKIFYINTGYEYWGRAASLIHTDLEGVKDVLPLENERIYHISSGQHFVNSFPPGSNSKMADGNIYRGNHLDFSVNYRALLVALVSWVKESKSPPENHFPKIKDNTLVSIEALDFPSIPGVNIPGVLHTAYQVDYGPRWHEGIIDYQPPKLGDPIQPKVAQVDVYGNEIAGINNVEVIMPLATYTPWNLREGMAGEEHELSDFRGSFIPFPKTDKIKRRLNDQRPSIESLYRSKEDFLDKIEYAAGMVIRKGFLLPEDADYVKENASKCWDWIMTN